MCSSQSPVFFHQTTFFFLSVKTTFVLVLDQVPEVIYQVLEEPDAKTFAIKLKSMVTFLEKRTRTAKIQEYLYRHVASSSIPKQLHCLTLRLANEHSTNANARFQLPSAELIPALVDNSFFHFVLASDNVLAASVVASSLIHHSLHPEKVVLHIITDRKTYAPMQAWFSLHSLTPPGLIAFHGHVHVIDPFWHMLGLGYQDNTTIADAESAGVIHFNGRAKPWLDIAFPQLRPLWTKYLDFSDRFIKRWRIVDEYMAFGAEMTTQHELQILRVFLNSEFSNISQFI